MPTMAKRNVRIPKATDDQIREHVEWLREHFPEHEWTEASFVRWCLALGCQATHASRRHDRSPGSGPDLSDVLAGAWDRYAAAVREVTP